VKKQLRVREAQKQSRRGEAEPQGEASVSSPVCLVRGLAFYGRVLVQTFRFLISRGVSDWERSLYGPLG
jgi:hypothetical protein